MKFENGDRVKHRDLGLDALVVEDYEQFFVLVEHDGMEYIWNRDQVISMVLADDDFLEYDAEDEKTTECVCSSWTLFNFGCKCGYVEGGGK